MDIVEQKKALLIKLDELEQDYNPELRLLRIPFATPGYHSTLRDREYVHGTLKSFIYALGLLDSEREDYRNRAVDILEQLVSMQDQDRSRATFGIWPWFYEETLDEMSPPDWNWADFCGNQLILTEIRHGHRLPEKLRGQIQAAIFHACDAIIKRNVGPGYTNIAIMGSFVTLVAGEYYEKPDYAQYGKQRLQNFYEYTKQLGTFDEYNSPNYAPISIRELSKIKAYAGDEAAIRMSNELLDIAWTMVARHYHPPTGQWGGPHSRSYSTLLTDETRSFLQLAVGKQVHFVDCEEQLFALGWFQNGVQCPDFCIPLFQEVQPEPIRQVYHRSEADKAPQAVHYATPQFCLGTFTKEIMWNQRRVMVAYVENGGGTVYLNLRFLHDGYDYCSAVFHSQQVNGDVLAGVSFIANGGDTHPNLDWIDGSIEAEDFRLRLEIGGKLEGIQLEAEGSKAAVHIGETVMRLNLAHAEFAMKDGEPIGTRPSFQWQKSQEGGIQAVDLVFHSGDRTKIDFRLLERAVVAMSVALGASGKEPVEVAIEEADGELCVRSKDEGRLAGEMLALPLKPAEIVRH